MALLSEPNHRSARTMEAVIPAQAQRAVAERRLSGPEHCSVVSIAGRPIAADRAPYIVAELSGNHGGDIRRLYNLIAAAKRSGADAVKLQTYTPGELTTPLSPTWALYEKAQTPRKWHNELFAYARGLGITIFSSAFSQDGVRFLVDLGAPAIKIASPEIGDSRLLHAAMDTGLPLIVSTGMAEPKDINRLPERAILLHCVAKYPSKIEDSNLSAITTLRNEYGDLVGLSDHTPGYETAIAATALGAVMIEKHLKLEGDDGCIDSLFSLEPKQFAAMASACRAIWAGMGDGVIRPTCEPRQR